MNKKRIKSICNTIIVTMIPVALFLLLYLLKPERISAANITSLLNQAILPSLLGFGLVCNLSVGNWDFAVGAEVMLIAILAGNFSIQLGWGIYGIILFSIILGAVIGFLNGALYVILKIPTLISSIGFMLLLESVAALVYKGNGFRGGSDLLVLGVYPQNYLIFAVLFGIIFYLYNYRPFGSWVKAVGKNPHIAKNNGINVEKVKFYSLFLAGIYSGFYAFMNLGTSGTVRVVTEMGTMSTAFDGMMCVFIGMALSTLTNLIYGVFLGALLLQTIKLGLVVLEFPTEMSQIVIALFVLIFIAYSGIQNKKLERQTRKALMSDDEPEVVLNE